MTGCAHNSNHIDPLASLAGGSLTLLSRLLFLFVAPMVSVLPTGLWRKPDTAMKGLGAMAVDGEEPPPLESDGSKQLASGPTHRATPASFSTSTSVLSIPASSASAPSSAATASSSSSASASSASTPAKTPLHSSAAAAPAPPTTKKRPLLPSEDTEVLHHSTTTSLAALSYYRIDALDALCRTYPHATPQVCFYDT
jgi:hypothetical protein